MSSASILVVYLAFLFGVALWSGRRVETEEDYLVAGRRLPLFLSVGTLLATWFGAGTLLTATDEIRLNGLRACALEPYGAGLSLILAGLFFAEPLRRSGALTFSDLMRRRFGRTAEALSVAVAVPSYAGWVAVQFVALAGVAHLYFGVPVTAALFAIAAIGMAYTLIGGMWSVTLTDTIQLLVIIPGLLLLAGKALFLLGAEGGLSGAVAAAGSAAPAGHLVLVPHGSAGEAFTWLNVLAIAALGNVPCQDLVQRMSAARTGQIARRACLISGVLYCVLGTIPVLLATASHRLLPDAPAEAVLPALARALLTPGMTVVFMLSLVSVVLSSVTSGILSPASQIARNFLRERIPEETVSSLALARLSVVAVTLLSLSIAMAGGRAYGILEESYAIGLVGFFVPFTIALRTRSWHGGAAVTAIAAGTGVWAVQFFVTTEVPLDLLATAASAGAYFLHYRTAAALGRLQAAGVSAAGEPLPDPV